MDFGVPGEAIGKALGGILGQKRESKKTWKKRMEAASLGGQRGPGKGRIWKGLDTKSPSSPWPTLWGWAGGLNRQGRNHRPPIHSEGLVKMPWAGQGNWFLFFSLGMRLTLYRFFEYFYSILGQKTGQKSERNLKNTFLHKNTKKYQKSTQLE